MNIAAFLFGHLAGPECRRALGRGWLIVFRTLVGMLLATVVVAMLWVWWLNVLSGTSIALGDIAGIAMSVAGIILLTLAVVQAPAVLAGSLAGERERGVLQLLLTTAVSPREIVAGRLVGKLSQVGMILLAGVPLLALLAAWNDLSVLQVGTFFALLGAVGFGGGGLAVGSSVVSRRGRDALLSVYMIILILHLSPLLTHFGLLAAAGDWLEFFNPYFTMSALIGTGMVAPAWATCGLWLVMGLTGAALAAWRLRPTSLAFGETVKKSHRPILVPPIGDRPMLWKELYIERAGGLGRFGRWLGTLITLIIGGGSLVLGALIVATHLWPSATGSSRWAIDFLGVSLSSGNRMLMGWLLQWGIGLRAAVSIASERERGSWDLLLMSPLQPGEIVRAKLSGSVFALRWMAIAMVFACTLAVVIGAIDRGGYLSWIAANATAGALMASLGVRCSLFLPTATRAMSWTIALWIVGNAVVAFLALSVIASVCLAFIAIWMAAIQYGFAAIDSPPWFPLTFGTAWPLTANLVTLVIMFLIALDTIVRFDRIAGRMAGGKVAMNVDQWLHGLALEPVFLPERKPLVSTESPS